MANSGLAAVIGAWEGHPAAVLAGIVAIVEVGTQWVQRANRLGVARGLLHKVGKRVPLLRLVCAIWNTFHERMTVLLVWIDGYNGARNPAWVGKCLSKQPPHLKIGRCNREAYDHKSTG